MILPPASPTHIRKRRLAGCLSLVLMRQGFIGGASKRPSAHSSAPDSSTNVDRQGNDVKGDGVVAFSQPYKLTARLTTAVPHNFLLLAREIQGIETLLSVNTVGETVTERIPTISGGSCVVFLQGRPNRIREAQRFTTPWGPGRPDSSPLGPSEIPRSPSLSIFHHLPGVENRLTGQST